MYIEPNSDVYLLSNCPLDNSYEHTIYFPNRTTQFNYFNGLVKYRFDKQSYQRYSKGVIHLNVVSDKAYDCNYIMFRNTSYGNKWFYGFITDIEYVNNRSSYIHYQIDEIQTWFLDCSLKECFVEREHSQTDNIGDNTQPESVELGGYITTNTKKFNYGLEVIRSLGSDEGFSFTTNNKVIIYITDRGSNVPGDEKYNPLYNAFKPGGVVSGYPTGLYYSVFDLTKDSILNVTELLSKSGLSDGIVAMSVLPNKYANADVGPYGGSDANEYYVQGATRTLPITVNNKKLYTYPYCVNCLIGNGSAIELKYELFDEDTPTFTIVSTISGVSETSIFPTSYAGADNNYEYSIKGEAGQLLAWSNNYYQNWLAQKGSTFTASLISVEAGGLISAGLGVLSTVAISNPVTAGLAIAGGVAGLVNSGLNVGKLLAEKTHQASIPNTLGGMLESASTRFANNEAGFYNYCRTIKPEYLRIIDSYFDRFGYATNITKIPNISYRRHWNYIKTQGCDIVGKAPTSAIKTICSIFDKGITFWKNGDNVGNYDLDNTI